MGILFMPLTMYMLNTTFGTLLEKCSSHGYNPA